jgi:archaellin
MDILLKSDLIFINNTYILEKEYDWKGIMIEIDNNWINKYIEKRPNSIHILSDATIIDYKELFINNNVPKNIDYLQIDLEVENGSTLKTLQKLNIEIMNEYKFATITFEHDIYHTNFMNTRLESRKIFENRGYIRVFSDINNRGTNPYEDWYVHPDLIDKNIIDIIMSNNSKNYKTNIISIKEFPESIVEKTINFQDIEY